MTNLQCEYSFDVLSYPRDSVEEAIIIDAPEELLNDRRYALNVQHIGRCVTSQESDIGDYARITTGLDTKLTATMVVSSSEERARKAVDVGMGAVYAHDGQGVAQAIDLLRSTPKDTIGGLYDNPLYAPLSYAEVAAALYKPGEIHTVGFVGRTGAGKSTTINNLVFAVEQQGGHSGKFEVDAFFIRSRKDRRIWLNDPNITDEERAARSRVTTWWDLGRAANTLDRIKQGDHVQLTGLYDMQKGGEMVGELDIDPGTDGHTIFVEGTALLVPELRDSIDTFVYFNTHDAVRTEFLMQRNTRDGYTLQESHARKELTDKAETEDHIAKPLRHLRYSMGSLAVLDNTQRTDTLRLMPPFIPEK